MKTISKKLFTFIASVMFALSLTSCSDQQPTDEAANEAPMEESSETTTN